MNISSILEKVTLFEDLVVSSGFKRDLEDYITSMGQAQNQNLVYMKDISEKVIDYLKVMDSYSLENELLIILKDTKPFMEENPRDKIRDLNLDTTIIARNYYSKLVNIMSTLNQKIDGNNSEVKRIKDMFSKYVTIDNKVLGNENEALVSLVFKDLKSTGSILEFSKVLKKWNTVLLQYHTILKSDSPKDEITLETIQSGSIDVIFNIDFDIALNLNELIYTGLKVYAAYLLYKSEKAKEIIDSYLGNKKLIEMEAKRESLMLDNIKESIINKINEQHNKNLEPDNNISTESLDKKISNVSSLITEHIIKGNELKLLSNNEEMKEENESDEEDNLDIKKEIKHQTSLVRERSKNLQKEDKQILIEKYEIKGDIEELK